MRKSAALLVCLFIAASSYGQRKTLSLQFVDHSVKPGDDFYMYANGKWYDTATIPAAENRAGARIEMDYSTRNNVRGILEKAAAAKKKPGSLEQKVGDFFASGMDTVAIEKRGYGPVKSLLAQVNALKTHKDVMRFVAEQYTHYNTMLIGFYVAADDKDSRNTIPVFYQSGLGLPDRDYYFKTDASTREVVQAYKNYVTNIFQLTGDNASEAQARMNAVYELEKQLAAGHRTNVALRDAQANYNKMAVADLDRQMPHIGWQELMGSLRVKADLVNVGQPGFYNRLDTLLQTVPMDTWKSYLRLCVLNNASSSLSTAFVQNQFNYTKALTGQRQLKPRWERIYNKIDGVMGEALGKLYVQTYFTPDAKQRIAALVNNLQTAFYMRIDKLDWMSDSTKIRAKQKLGTFLKKVGYPDKWRDYSKARINRNTYFENVSSCLQNEYNYMIGKLGKPVDRTEWGITPPTNNAYYNPTLNEIVFPAGILSFPMFDVNADDALNYGGIGMVIGHELTHGFDDQGAQYDKEGNLKNWWQKKDYEQFKAKGALVVDQYNRFVVLDSMHVNGALTQGENMADIGGLAIAYTAFKLTRQGQDTAKIDGLTPDQRFFLAFAQSWRKKLTVQALQQQIKTDPHSPGFFRINGPLMNFTPFYKAFNVQPGDKMYKPEAERISIWQCALPIPSVAGTDATKRYCLLAIRWYPDLHEELPDF